ncbi:TPA: hypothetical protein DIC39_02475 [Patescibacteria group bacterium]|nr:hypothetical protein [Patescibacteria group bacterium]HCU47898.1 hypothetical protein [Patescibacteria group bacterium]
MIAVRFTPSFVRQIQSLSDEIQEEIFQKVNLFKTQLNHRSLKVHKLKGRLAGRYSFSVNYHMRIVFEWLGKNEVLFHAIGDHDVYKD